ncbi:MAG: Hsp20/alpha crystallin family protein [Melioribacteraceae bacterium]|nr:Hsp20/alpha crystallin family protein [Melioribacteraceae bacterium]MCF8355388.1 Hsp20/alpha crystallin family protein [Melioribacteraceae bacterium]MCF8394633.1 Hsp20/alpha crystallin family protein [Melioribacteraceae bacterium]MCF8419630.1 Hsp20/alpha crystallin family protein [Melioribacteraceae bacterium]
MTEEKVNINNKENKSWEEALENESWVAPLIDIYETSEEYNLIANLPGVEKNGLKIKLEDGHLIIMGRIDYTDAMNKKYILKEIETGNYYRRFKIADAVDESKIDASFQNGQLTLSLPKHERLKPKNIEIK